MIITSSRKKPVVQEDDKEAVLLKEAFPNFFEDANEREDRMCQGEILDLVDINMLDKKDVEDKVKACINLVQAGEDKDEAMLELVEWIMNNFRSQRLYDYLEHESSYLMAGDVIMDNPVLELIKAQVDYAKQKHGGLFNSMHEGYAVLLEEMDELMEAVETAKGDIQEIWDAVKHDDFKRAYDILEDLQIDCRLGIDEISQVAAVAQKMIETMDGMNGAENKEDKND